MNPENETSQGNETPSLERVGKIKPTEAMKHLCSFMKEITDGDTQSLLLNLENSIAYMDEKLHIYEEMLQKATGNKKPQLDDDQKRRLAQAGERLNEYILSQIENTFAPSTVRKWYLDLVGSKYNSVAPGQRHRGPKELPPNVVDIIVYISKSNRYWGFKRIAAYLQYLGYDVSEYSVKRILKNHGIVPDPDGNCKHSWKTFIDAHREITSSCDFATTEILAPGGLMRYHMLFFEDISTREVCLGGIVHDPDGMWVTQVARNMCDMWEGKLLGKEYLIHDGDYLFGTGFDSVLSSIGITSRKLPRRSPELNGHIESFIKTFKTECLNHVILTSESQLRYVVHQWLEYYNHERPHSGIGWQMIKPWPQPPDGVVHEFSRLGGLLKSYRRIKRNGGDDGASDFGEPLSAMA